MRLLLVGGGDRGLDLARDLAADGHAVRVASPSEDGRAAIEAAGAECWIGDPDRIESLRYAVDGVTVLLWCLAADQRPELHGSRLRMMLERTVDSTVRAVVYEAGGAHTEAGVTEMERARSTNTIPYATFPADAPDWVAAARAAIGDALGAKL